MLDLYLLNGVKLSDGSMLNSSYTTWNDLLNTMEYQMQKFNSEQEIIATLFITALVTGAAIISILEPAVGIPILFGTALRNAILNP